MAPLSVHSSGGGTTSAVPASKASRCSALRIAWLAATPPAATSAVGVPQRVAEQPQAGRRRSTIDVDDGLLEGRAEIGDVLVA